MNIISMTINTAAVRDIFILNILKGRIQLVENKFSIILS